MSKTANTPNTSKARPEWAAAKRVVIKIGSALLVDRATGRLRATWLNSLADDVATLAAEGKDVILVSSGAIALGRHALGLAKGSLELEQSQAAAAVGQVSLAHAYQNVFLARGLATAQILLTLGDTEERRRYLNARRTIETLLAHKAIPVVNENDTVATSEIRYGDNDRLSARVASMLSADCLVLLSDIDGLYTAPPAQDPTATHIPVVTAITPDIEAMAGDAGTELSKGGMKTKVEAGRIALAAGTHMVITTGKPLHPLGRISDGCTCTWFLASSEALDRWAARAKRRDHRRCRGREGAIGRQEPAASRRRQGRRQLRARRRRGHSRQRRARTRARTHCLRGSRSGHDRGQEVRRDRSAIGPFRPRRTHPPRRHGGNAGGVRRRRCLAIATESPYI
jgi:glutamate 5-kinase